MQLWTKLHAITIIPTTIGMIVIALILRLFLKNKSEKFKFIPFQIIAIVLVILEIMKQIDQLTDGYSLYSLPFHFCSLFIFLPIIMAFYRGKFDQHVRAITTMACAALFMFMMIYPDLVYGEGSIRNMGSDFLSFHTVVFHNLAMFEFILIIALNLYTPNTKRDMKILFIFFALYCVFEAIMAQIFKENYNSMYYCAIAPIESLRLTLHSSLGQFFGQSLYCLGVTIADLAFVSLGYWIYRLITFIISMLAKNKTVKQ